MRSPTLSEKIKYFNCNARFVGFDKHEGWREELPFYEFDCETHGKVVNYPIGHEEKLICPKCLKELS
jgi:hypothetical protein